MIIEGNPELGLQKHQQDAYKSVKKAYETRNKASVVIPTGCGKSFIALQLMADNKDKRILFMAPTNAIKNQMYNYIAKYIANEEPTSERTSRMIADEYFPNLKIMLYPSLLKVKEEQMEKLNADIFCIQETKMQKGQLEINFDGYKMFLNSAVRKGYSGTAIFTKIEPINVSYGIGIEEHDQEGRVITLEFKNFYLVNCYTPNAQRELTRLEYRMKWEDDFREYLKKLDKTKPVILCGDLNVAHNEIDLKNPKSNKGNAGFTDEERSQMTNLLNSGFVDSFRYLYPEKQDAYSWWSYMGRAREKNVGWRIDYFIVSEKIKDKIVDAKIYPEIMGSDHCPVELDVEI